MTEVEASPVALARFVLWRAMTEVAGGASVSFADVGRALDLVNRTGGPFDGPRQRVQRIGPDVVLTGRPAGAAGRPAGRLEWAAPFHYLLSVPGEVHLVEAASSVSAEIAGAFEGADSVSGRGAMAAVRLDRCGTALRVRNRRAGDRFRPFGSASWKKLQDFFVDRKVPRERRDFVPIVVDASDRPVWVAGYAIDEEFRVTDSAQAVIILRLKGLGGSD